MIPKSQILANLSSAATVLSPDRARVLTFDREGRWIYYYRCPETFKRSLASEVHLRSRRESRERGRLERPETKALFDEVYDLVHEFIAVTEGEVRERLEGEILPWTPERLLGESERFDRAYRPITILPPDQYLSVVLQAAEGCTWNGCTFCNFYTGRPFWLLSGSEFRQHAERVHGLLGRGLRLRRGIFLGDGNALAISIDQLDPLLECAREIFPGRDFFGFVDLFSGDRRQQDQWEALRDRGLRRVYVGMETGLDELLEFVDKPGSGQELVRFVTTLKRAGLGVALIVMVGLGGEDYRLRHREASLKLLLGLPLIPAEDLVYLSPFLEDRNSRYRQRREAAGLTPMSEWEVEAEVTLMASSLRAGGLRVSRYDIREFVY